MENNNILENIKRKLKENPNYDLSISELKVLSKCNYETIEQILGKKFVARTPNEITINTICYVGTLKIEEPLPTYNLKYIFGNLDIFINNINLENLKYVSELSELSEFFSIYENNNKELVLEELFDNSSFMLYAVNRNEYYVLKYASKELKSDREFMMEVVKQNRRALEYAEEELRNDKDFMLEVVKQDELALKYTTEELRNNKEFMLEVIKQYEWALKYASEELQDDKDFILEVVKQNRWALEYVKEEFKKDKEFMLKAVKQDYWALKYAKEELRNDKEFMLEIIKQYGFTIGYASKQLQDDKDFVLEAVKQNLQVLKYISEKLRNDRVFMLEVVKTGIIPSNLPDKYYDDEEIMFESIKNLATTLKEYFINIVIKEKRPFSDYYEFIIYSELYLDLNISRKYTSNRDFMLEMVKQCGWAYVLVLDNLINDKEIMSEAIKQDESIKDYLKMAYDDFDTLIEEQIDTNLKIYTRE